VRDAAERRAPRELLMGALRLLPMEAPNELLLEALRELLGGAPKGAAIELLKVVPCI